MIIPKGSKLSPEQLAEVEKIAEDFDCSILEIQGHNRCVYAILGDESREVMFKRIAGLHFIHKVDMIESPYKLMDRRSGLSDHTLKIGDREEKYCQIDQDGSITSVNLRTMQDMLSGCCLNTNTARHVPKSSSRLVGSRSAGWDIKSTHR